MNLGSNNQVKNEILTKLLTDNYLNYKTFAKTYSKAKPYITSAIQIRKLDSISNILFKVSEGQPSPVFAFEDINGKIVRLEDIKGSFIFIDIWATWCKPCIQEYGYLLSIEDSLKNENIKFVSICYNDNKDRWKKTVIYNNLQGIQLFATDINDQFFKSYMVVGIPHFILLDPNKIIVSNNDSRIRPSSKGTFNYLKNTIQGLNKSK